MYLISGKFTKIIYSDSTNNFYVLSFKIGSNQEEQKKNLEIKDTVNYIPVISKDNDFELKVFYEIQLEKQNSKKYGLSYFIINKIPIFKDNKESAIAFLSSKLFFGISKISAKKIIDNIGIKLFESPDNYKSDLISLVGNKKSRIIIEGLKNQNSFQKIYHTFIGNRLSTAILDTINLIIPSNELESFLQKNIFSIIDKFENIDFIELNKIAKLFVSDYSEELMISNLIMWCIYQLENDNGSTIISIFDVFIRVKKYVSIEKNIFTKYLQKLISDNKVIIHFDKKTLTSSQMYEKEKFICNFLFKLKNKKINYSYKNLITNNLDGFQKKALTDCLENSFSIITGFPGTGKTLLINLIIKNFKQLNKKNIELLAPTGKAATQISQKTNQQAKTIHSFLKYNKIGFEVNEKHPSSAEIIIIDEFSMVSIKNFYSILIAVPNLKQLILIGDKNQLPSIGAGYLLNDLISSNLFVTSNLTKIYRQNTKSSIITNALLINEAKLPVFNTDDTQLVELTNIYDVNDFVKEYIKNYLKKHKNLQNQQILIPMYSGLNGINNVNLEIQKIINKNSNMLFTLNSKDFYENDKVIQIENDIEKNIFNGEIGYIKMALFNNKNELEFIKVLFDNKMVQYTTNEFNNNIKLAYAISVHKFQGSECLDVLLIFLDEHLHMLTKKLIYTAYTRAIKNVIMISSKEIIFKGINNDADSLRKCNIIKLLNEKSL